MKTSTILFLVGSVVIIGGGALAFSLVTQPATDVVVPLTNTASTSTTAESDTMTGSASILNLMNEVKGKSMECTFVFTGEGSRSEGTGFFVEGKSRVDMLYNDETNKQIASYMIMDKPADTMYVWSLVNGEQTGVKMSISENEKTAAAMAKNNPATKTAPGMPQMSPESDVQYNCKPWTPDTTVFIAPTEVKFTDMTEMTKMMSDMMGGMKLPTQ